MIYYLDGDNILYTTYSIPTRSNNNNELFARTGSSKCGSNERQIIYPCSIESVLTTHTPILYWVYTNNNIIILSDGKLLKTEAPFVRACNDR